MIFHMFEFVYKMGVSELPMHCEFHQGCGIVFPNLEFLSKHLKVFSVSSLTLLFLSQGKPCGGTNKRTGGTNGESYRLK